jgi:hypothetical protein
MYWWERAGEVEESGEGTYDFALPREQDEVARRCQQDQWEMVAADDSLDGHRGL